MLSVAHTPCHDPVPASFNLAGYVLAAGAATPDKTALRIVGQSPEVWTYAQLTQAIRGVATGLTAQGLVAGDRVIIRLGNSADFPIAFLGCITAGLIPVPLSMQLTAPEVASITKAIAPRAHIGADGNIAQAQLRAYYDLPPAPFMMGDAKRPAYIIHTSGTSGRARAVVHAHRAIWARRRMWDGWYGLTSDDRMMHAGAFNWTYTLGTGLLDPWAIGATALIPAQDTDAQDLPQLIAAHKATLFAAAPAVYRRLLRGDLPKFTQLRHGLSAGEKMPQITRDRWVAQTGTPVHEAFGMTECSTFISGSPDAPAPDGTSGFAQTGRHIAIVDETGPVPRGTIGQIAVHRDEPGLMLGYDGAAPMTDTWFRTGDIARMDTDGTITYLGRADDMMNAGGIRVSPLEVEDTLQSYPDITQAAAVVVGINADTSLIAAFYVSTNVIDEDELGRFMQARLAGYKCPRLYIRRDTLPRGANNKLLRQKLRHEWETAHGQA